MKVDVLGPDAAMRTFTARLEGTYKGKPTPSPTFVTAITIGRTASGRSGSQITAVQP